MKRALAIALPGLLLLAPPCAAEAEASRIGAATIAGAVRIDARPASGVVELRGAARVATGGDGTVSLALEGGGEVRLGNEADAVFLSENGSLRVHVICGQVRVASVDPVTVLSLDGGRVEQIEGTATVTAAHHSRTLKAGKRRTFDEDIAVKTGGPGTTTVVTSRYDCACNCPTFEKGSKPKEERKP